MKSPLFVRQLTRAERQALTAALRAPESLTLRRAHIVLASADGRTPYQIAAALTCASQTVRNGIHAFNTTGLAALNPTSRRPTTIETAWDEAAQARLMDIAHWSPRAFGKTRSPWTLGLLAEVSCEQGLTETVVDQATVRRTIRRLGASWNRAKHWSTSPDEQYALKKATRSSDRAGTPAPGLEARVCRRSLVEPVGTAEDAELGV